MEMEQKNLDIKFFNMEVETQGKLGSQNEARFVTDFASQEMEINMEAREKSGSEEDEEVKMNESGTSEDSVGGFNRNNKAPVDEVCPICFDKLNIPCRTNCGHWFCAGCIMQFWTYRLSIQQCKCPLCCCAISNLAPEVSEVIHPTEDDAEVLKKVQQYNGLSDGGMHGLFQKVLALPLFMSTIFRICTDPDALRYVYYVTRLLGLLLAFLYEKGEYEFIPTGGFGIQRTADIGASVLYGTLFFVGVVYRCVLKRRARRAEVLQDGNM